MLITQAFHFLGFEEDLLGNNEKIFISNISNSNLSTSNGYTFSSYNVCHTLTSTTNQIVMYKLCVDNDIFVEVLFPTVANYSQLKVFGCECFQ